MEVDSYLECVCREMKQGMTEHEIAAILAQKVTCETNEFFARTGEWVYILVEVDGKTFERPDRLVR